MFVLCTLGKRSLVVATILFLLHLVGCRQWTPYAIPGNIQSNISCTKPDAIKVLNSFLYTCHAHGYSDLLQCRGEDVHDAQLLFRDDGILEVRGHLEHLESTGRSDTTFSSRGSTTKTYYRVETEPYIATIRYDEINEIWIADKEGIKRVTYVSPDAKMGYVITFAGDRRWKSIVGSVAITGDAYSSYLKAIITVFPHAKLSRYKPGL